MIESFNFFQPTRIRFGWGRVNEIGKVVALNGKRCLLVTVKSSPPLQALFEKIKSLCIEAGVEIFHFDGVIPSPTIESVNQGSKMAVKNKIDVVLGVGGGSSIDTAKAISVGATHEGSAWEYRLGQKRIVNNKLLPIIAVPTTAGTGSEVTTMSVLKDPENEFKSALADWGLCPRVSIVDPKVTLTLPSHISASTGFDTFCHAFESYLHKRASYFNDILCLEVIKQVIKYLPSVIANGSDRQAREALSWSSTVGGICITSAGTTLPHGIGMAIGGHISNVMHGEALAIMYPEINRWTWKHAIPKYATIGRFFNIELENKSDEVAAEECCNEMDNFLKKIDMWQSLKDKNLTESKLKAISEDTMKLKNYTVHPKVATHEEIENLIRKSSKR
ncbi:MAG: iron-containing alcohol dehydrogenase [Promethearchaeota archaeon]|nr:MAG: iron-containing alcohol dehydrogenase [Candidatus Lokiarchaeota archaeon]